MNAREKINDLIEKDKGEKKKVILVYYVGGITYAEMSCYRLLTKQFASKCGINFIIATTQFINSNKMMDAFKDDFTSQINNQTSEN